MYYENKSKFYIKQYGTLIVVIILSIALIGCGIYVFLSGKDKTPNNDIIADNNIQTEEQDKNQEEKPLENNIVTDPEPEVPEEEFEDDGELLTIFLGNLDTLEKSDDVVVKSVNLTDNTITVKSENKNINITLIGIDYTNAISNINEKINEDLIGKTVKIAFDNKKTDEENKKVYAYIYINDILYNETILENGYAKLKDEETNNSLVNSLKQSQAFGKQTKAGIWNI